MQKQARAFVVAAIFSAAVYGIIVLWGRSTAYGSGLVGLVAVAGVFLLAPVMIACTARWLRSGPSLAGLVFALATGFVITWVWLSRDDFACWSCRGGDFTNGGYAILNAIVLVVWATVTSVLLGAGIFIAVGVLDLARSHRTADGRPDGA